jgi:predicted metal-dependent phosphoesterase TrpH
MHTRYSDGHGSHREIAQAAIKAGLDAIIVTDHNVLVNGMEKYVQNGNKRVLMLVGEEGHDPTRLPQKNHLLVFGASQELSSLAYEPQNLSMAFVGMAGYHFLLILSTWQRRQ